MAWKQDISPNVNIACTPGWCEQYVRSAFKQPAKYPTATAAWQGQEDKHTDRKQPGVAVPVYWSVDGVPAGHDAIWMPDGSVFSASHPTSKSPMKFANLEAIEKYYRGRLKWRGWGSFVSHVKVAHWEADPAPQPAPQPAPSPSPAPSAPVGPSIGDRVTTTATKDAGNGKGLNLSIINDRNSVWTEVNSKGNAVLRKDGVVRTQVPVSSLRKV